MSFTNPITWVASQLVTAALLNQQVRDNLTALWPYTTAGDIGYKSAAAELARLGIGTASQTLGVGATSGLPEWQSAIGCKAGRSTAQSIPNATVTEITGLDVEYYDNGGFHTGTDADFSVSTGLTGYYLIIASGYFAGNATADTQREIGILKNGSNVIFAHTSSNAPGASMWMNLTAIYNWDDTGDKLSISVSQGSGGALNFRDAKLAVIKLR